VCKAVTKAELPDLIAQGFVLVGGLRTLDLGKVLCYQNAQFHTGITLFSSDGQACVYVQMYQLPEGERQLEEDSSFQLQGKKWGKLSPKASSLQLHIFPADWTHAVSSQNPKRVILQYRGPNRALFVRYTGNSLEHPLFLGYNKHVRYLAGEWHTEMMHRELLNQGWQEWSVLAESSVAPEAIVEAVQLREEQAALRKMILGGVERFASDQRDPGGDVYNIPVTGIVVWFDVPNGYTSVHFDVRAPFEVDGAYSHQEFMALNRENWRQFGERLEDGHAVTLTGLDGRANTLEPGSDFNVDEAIGLMVLDLVKAMRAEKAFAPLLLAQGAELIIEADDGAFSWPSYEHRGTENRV
jgi:hypothetical protein